MTSREQRRATLKDVAARAGVSAAAVSYALNDPDRLPEATRDRIVAAARELGYTRNGAARALRTGAARTIGVLLSQSIDEVLANPYYAEFLRGVGSVCRDEGLALVLVPPRGARSLDAIEDVVSDGFLVAGVEAHDPDVAALVHAGIPLVLIDSERIAGVPNVGVDDAAGMYSALAHLVDIGHRDIAVVAIDTGGPPRDHWRGTVARRTAGIADLVASGQEAAGTLAIREVQVAATRDGGVEAVSALWDVQDAVVPHPPTALLCFADVIAIGAIEALRERGIRVPRDVSVVGFDDVPEARWGTPALTTVNQSAVEKGRTAAGVLARCMAGEDVANLRIELPTALVVRASTARPVR